MNKRVDRWEEGIIQLAWYNEYPNKSNEGKEKNGKKPFLRLYPTIKYGPANDGRLRKYSQGLLEKKASVLLNKVPWMTLLSSLCIQDLVQVIKGNGQLFFPASDQFR